MIGVFFSEGELTSLDGIMSGKSKIFTEQIFMTLFIYRFESLSKGSLEISYMLKNALLSIFNNNQNYFYLNVQIKKHKKSLTKLCIPYYTIMCT